MTTDTKPKIKFLAYLLSSDGGDPATLCENNELIVNLIMVAGKLAYTVKRSTQIDLKVDHAGFTIDSGPDYARRFGLSDHPEHFSCADVHEALHWMKISRTARYEMFGEEFTIANLEFYQTVQWQACLRRLAKKPSAPREFEMTSSFGTMAS